MSKLPEGWTRSSLGEISAEVRNGISAKPDQADGLAILRISAVRPMRLDTSDTRFLRSDFDGADAYKLRVDDLLFTRYNGNRDFVGVCARVPELHSDLVYPDKLIRVRIRRDRADPRFVERAVHTEDARQFIEERLKTSAGQVGVSGADLKSLTIPLPPLPEQKRITHKLDTLLARVDACRNHLARVPAILKRFRQSILAAATGGELTREWREERGLTEEWSLTQIDQISTVGTGSTPLRSNDAFYAQTGTPWVTSAATGLPFVDTAAEFVTDAAISAHRLKRYAPGTLLVAMYGEGKTRGQVTELRIEATINQACAAISVDERKATRAFVRIALESNYLKMRDLAEGGNQPNLNLSKIKEFPVLLPGIEEQRQIVKRVHELFALADQLEARHTNARTHIDRLTPALLAKAFRGELVPQVPGDTCANPARSGRVEPLSRKAKPEPNRR